MATTVSNFIAGRMNKSVDERLLPPGEYVNAINLRLGSTEETEVGSVENSKGNTQLTTLSFNGQPISASAKCIGAYEDGQRETLYWFVHDPAFNSFAYDVLDLIVSYNVQLNLLTYHVITPGNTANPSVLNFNPDFLITGVNRVENLLFFTDNFNQPRFINITRSYDFNDSFLAEQLLVIKKPPAGRPELEFLTLAGEENFLEDKFITFAYRYKYADGEYSALSQFTDPAFAPSTFEYDISSGLNEGMQNIFNGVRVVYNSGGPLVKEIEVVFKETTSNVVKSIEKFDKFELGYADNTNYDLTFDNSKIFSVLASTQLARTFDNVPLRAKAQTIMGNRLMYGNYFDGFDLIDINTNPIRLEYNADLITEDIADAELEDRLEDGNYSLNGNVTINSAEVYFDLAGLELKEGSLLSFDIQLAHSQFTGDTPFPAQTNINLDGGFTFLLPSDFNSVYELSVDPAFELIVGTNANILPVVVPGDPTADTSCEGITATDAFNCSIATLLDGILTKFASGITGSQQAIRIISSPGSTEIGFQFPAMQYVDDILAPTINVFEYYAITFAGGDFIGIGNPKSLHSNRDYEVGIIYMDEFNRSTTALVSPNNTVHVGCSLAQNKNEIQISIPPQQLAPFWAKKYKFCIKTDLERYQTIFTNIFLRGEAGADTFFLLEGENAQKVEQGDRLRVKADSQGPTQRCQYATVLEKKAYAQGELEITTEDGTSIDAPAGTYMTIKANDFSAEVTDDAVVDLGSHGRCERDGNSHPLLRYACSINFDGSQWQDIDIPAGSRIKIFAKFRRRGGPGRKCDKREYIVELNLTSARDYTSFDDYFNGDQVGLRLNDGTNIIDSNPDCVDGADMVYISSPASSPNDIPQDRCFYYWRFYRDPSTNLLSLLLRGTNSCQGSKHVKRKRACIDARIEIIRSGETMIFETQPEDAIPDLWYESADVYDIDPATGFHSGNVLNQNGNDPAIIDTDFFNCFSFGNGCESYRVRDSLTGKDFQLGERTTSTGETEFKEVHRFADITYSGVYNNESNVNKLNEFNLGLLNFKSCEDVYGPIEIIDARETDVLVLQEDKISFVLAGKNLLSDSAGGGTIASVPEVLGTQIARIEEYGISRNPESFCKWGYDKFFTDAKRGAVIQLKGGSGQNEQLNVISELGMRSWFRDRFSESLNKQKIGGYDPYMNEYVLSINDEDLPEEFPCIECGIERTFTFPEDKVINYCVDVTQFVGSVKVDVIATTPAVFSSSILSAVYNSATVINNEILTNGDFQFVIDKNVVTQDTIDITIDGKEGTTVQIVVNCPEAPTINIYSISLTNSTDVDKTIHNEYRWVDGSFVSPLHSELVEFQDGTDAIIISQYTVVSGPQGAGIIPADGAEVKIISNQKPTDDFVFLPTVNKFYSLRTNVLYGATPAEMILLLNAAGTPLTIDESQAPIYSGEFTMPVGGDNLYLIYDYRQPTPASLCVNDDDPVDAVSVCCDCEEPTPPPTCDDRPDDNKYMTTRVPALPSVNPVVPATLYFNAYATTAEWLTAMTTYMNNWTNEFGACTGFCPKGNSMVRAFHTPGLVVATGKLYRLVNQPNGCATELRNLRATYDIRNIGNIHDFRYGFLWGAQYWNDITQQPDDYYIIETDSNGVITKNQKLNTL